MPKPLLVILLLICSCSSISETERRRQSLNGNWLIISPDHNLADASQYRAYSKIQDSIIGLMGLKLVKLSEDGRFEQLDSAGKTGRWGMTPDYIVFIESGGRGFDHFSARYSDYNRGMLHLTQFVETEGEQIELTWNLKKITGEYAKKLFDAGKNSWRIKPTQAETDQQIRQRLSAILQYYSDYYLLVTRESDFFISRRVMLPLTFYQHAMAMKDFDEESIFSHLFFDKQQAEEAWKYLKRALNKLRDDFPSKKDFLEEYAEFMHRMAEEVVKI